MENQNIATLTLEQLSMKVERLLKEKGFLGTTPDNRVTPAPDGRTIRYYTTLGLLDRPGIEDRQARYTSRHVLQLLAIKSLQSLSMPLAEIQGRLYGRSDDELEALIASLVEEHRDRTLSLPLLQWNEIVIEPGLRLMLSPDTIEHIEPDKVSAKIRAALAALKSTWRQRERRKKDE